ncbi:FGGY family carbohydrate kinase, partial [Vibrio parahaemolyticus]
SAKDYLCLALTGERVTDPSTAAGNAAFELASGAFAPDLCTRFALRPAQLPAVRASTALAGRLDADGGALLGLPAG